METNNAKLQVYPKILAENNREKYRHSLRRYWKQQATCHLSCRRFPQEISKLNTQLPHATCLLTLL